MPKPNRLPLVLSILLLCGIAGYFVLRSRLQRPGLLIQSSRAIANATWHDGGWYWLEKEGANNVRLVHIKEGGIEAVGAGDRISAYDVGEGNAVWTARQGENWMISLSIHGSAPQTLWTGAIEPRGLHIASGHIFWLAQMPAVVPNAGLFPPLASKLNLFSTPVAGGTPTVVATLPEILGGQVMGVSDNQVYVSAFRPGYPGVTTIYSVPLSGGPPHRIAGETGEQTALLTHDGILYWTAPSQESSERTRVICVRRRGKDGKIDTYTDWLISGGQLYETEHGSYYVDHSPMPAAWLLNDRKEFPHPVPMPQGYTAIAVGGDEVLLRSLQAPPGAFPVYRIGLP